MKTVIAALNSKYVHMSLAPWYLKAACEGIGEIKVLEFTINQDKSEIIKRLFEEKPDIVAFSCYIYNIIQIEAIVKDLKLILPKLIIILGGPEVSFDAAEFLAANDAVDFIVCGEGELRLKSLLSAVAGEKSPADIDGIAMRGNTGIKFTPPAELSGSLDELPSPYTAEMLSAAAGKILYFEASRGCPFSCSYCLSSIAAGVRRFDFERIKTDLLKIMNSDARQVKFVDRTFNCSLNNAKQIVKFILDSAKKDESGKTSGKNYHFEVAADLFDDELIGLLGGAPAGLFQLEIGIQSFNEKTLAAVGRKTNLELCGSNINKLLGFSNMHIHLDLIAGLPYEDYLSFADSFNRIFELRPHCIQLGFLKLLRGSKMRSDAQSYGYAYSQLAPYEVYSTPWLDYGSIIKLKGIETAVDALYNSGKFSTSLIYIIDKFSGAFSFFEIFSVYLNAFYPEGYGIPLRELYNLLLRFAALHLGKYETEMFSELAKFDFFLSDNSRNPPSSFSRYEIPGVRSLYIAQNRSRGRVHFERFTINPLCYANAQETAGGTFDLRFDYSEKNPVTGHFKAECIS